MLLRQIKYFVTVVDTGSFTEAAEECFISQSAISQQILSLEKELGVQLLRRNTRQFALTSAGKYLYSNGKNLLGEIEKLKKGTLEAAAANGGQLRLGYLNGYADERLYKAVAQFKQQNAGVNLQIASGSHDELAALLGSGKADIVFNWQRHVVAEGYGQQLLAAVPVYAELSTVYGGFENRRVELNDLKNLPCIFVADEKQQSAEKDFYTRVLGFSGEILFAHTAEEAHFMAVAGNGFWFVGSNKNQAVPDGVHILPVYSGGRQLEKKYYMFWKKDNENKYIRVFADIAAGAFAGQNRSAHNL